MLNRFEASQLFTEFTLKILERCPPRGGRFLNSSFEGTEKFQGRGRRRSCWVPMCMVASASMLPRPLKTTSIHSILLYCHYTDNFHFPYSSNYVSF